MKKTIKDIIRVLISDLMTCRDVLPTYGMQNERIFHMIEYDRILLRQKLKKNIIEESTSIHILFH